MSTGNQRRRRSAENLLRDANGLARRGATRSRDATRVVEEADRLIAELVAAGYRQLPDGRWANPLGQIVKGS
jgi:hypothetical protein